MVCRCTVVTMKRLCVVALLGLLLALSAAAPALAQRDPFKEGSGNSSQQEPPGDRGQNGVADPAPAPQTGPEVLPLTGPESMPWLGVAYVLVAMGAGALVLVRLYHPSGR